MKLLPWQSFPRIHVSAHGVAGALALVIHGIDSLRSFMRCVQSLRRRLAQQEAVGGGRRAGMGRRGVWATALPPATASRGSPASRKLMKIRDYELHCFSLQ